MRLLIAGLLCSASAFVVSAPAQTLSAPATEQDISIVFANIGKHADRVAPMLGEVRADDWVAKGAPETYTAQRNSAVEQLQAIRNDMAALAQHPERLPDNLKALFRIEAFHRSLDSLMGGLRKYQNSALADLIESVAAEDRGDLDRLEQYILDMTAEKQQQFEMMDREAQRCRATLSRQPAPPKR